MLEMIKSHSSLASQPMAVQKPKTKLPSKTESRVLVQKQSGSFLAQKKSKMSMLSSAAKASGGGGGSKGFVFKATEEEKLPKAPAQEEKENKGVPRKSTFPGPVKKRVKMTVDQQQGMSESQSIFDHL